LIGTSIRDFDGDVLWMEGRIHAGPQRLARGFVLGPQKAILHSCNGFESEKTHLGGNAMIGSIECNSHGIHHLTAGFGRCEGQSPLLHRHSWHAAGEKDRQSGRYISLSPLLRRWRGDARLRHDLLRWPVGPEKRGTHSIMRTAFRVNGAAWLAYWAERFAANGVSHSAIREIDGRLTLDFEDGEGQRLSLVDDGGAGPAFPWDRSSVPAKHRIRGLGPIRMSVPDLAPTAAFLTRVYEMRPVREYALPDESSTRVHVFEMRKGGPSAELHVAVEPGLPVAEQGAGSVHHVAFRAKDDAEYQGWIERYQRLGLRSSGPVDRFYLRASISASRTASSSRIATDGPGFATDETRKPWAKSSRCHPSSRDGGRRSKRGSSRYSSASARRAIDQRARWREIGRERAQGMPIDRRVRQGPNLLEEMPAGGDARRDRAFDEGRGVITRHMAGQREARGLREHEAIGRLDIREHARGIDPERPDRLVRLRPAQRPSRRSAAATAAIRASRLRPSRSLAWMAA